LSSLSSSSTGGSGGGVGLTHLHHKASKVHKSTSKSWDNLVKTLLLIPTKPNRHQLRM